MPRRRIAACLALVAAFAAGCGNDPQEPPIPEEAASPKRWVVARYPADGISFRAPANWRRAKGAPPLVATVISGEATVAIWRYPRTEPLPASHPQLARALGALSAAARRRDRSLKVEDAQVVDVAGVPGIQLVAVETIAERPRRVRSTHLFTQGAEIVVDAVAPPGQFANLDRTVFAPLLQSLRITTPGSTVPPGPVTSTTPTTPTTPATPTTPTTPATPSPPTTPPAATTPTAPAVPPTPTTPTTPTTPATPPTPPRAPETPDLGSPSP